MDLSEQIEAAAANLADCTDEEMSETYRANLGFLIATAADLGQDTSEIQLTTAIQRAATNVSGCADGDLSRIFRGNLSFLVEAGRGAARAPDAVFEGGTQSSDPAQNNLLSTTESAAALGISRPTLMRLIESGELDHVMVGTHHRIPAQSVQAYKQARLVSRDRIDEPPRSDRNPHNSGYRRTVQLSEGEEWV